jgi:hypothetical protein
LKVTAEAMVRRHLLSLPVLMSECSCSGLLADAICLAGLHGYVPSLEKTVHDVCDHYGGLSLDWYEKVRSGQGKAPGRPAS